MVRLAKPQAAGRIVARVWPGACAKAPCQAISWRHSRSRLIHSSSQRADQLVGTSLAGASLIAALRTWVSRLSMVAMFGSHHSSEVVRRPAGRRSGSMWKAEMEFKSKVAMSVVWT